MSQTLHQNVRTKVHTPWNRDSSRCITSRGAVIHSAAHRSTMFVDKEEHPESWASLLVWKNNKKAINAWVPVIVGGYTLESADQAAFQAVFPGWKLKVLPLQGGKVEYTATRNRRGLVTHLAAFNLEDIVRKTRNP